jgi:hypothetical protein
MIGRLVIAAALAVAGATAAQSHSIYTGFRGQGNVICCGESDCSQTVYEERGDRFFFLTREKHWIEVPADRITWLPIPGDVDDGTKNRAHLCYRPAMSYDTSPGSTIKSEDGEQEIHLYCAIVPPGAS